MPINIDKMKELGLCFVFYLFIFVFLLKTKLYALERLNKASC